MERQSNDFQTYLNEQKDGIVILKEQGTDKKNGLTFFNPAMEKVTGLTLTNNNALHSRVFKLIQAEKNKDQSSSLNLSESRADEEDFSLDTDAIYSFEDIVQMFQKG